MYSYPLYRPPSEAYSLILQVTEGCSHNQCEFCYMYKQKAFRVKSEEEIKEHLVLAKQHFPHPRRIFLADGNVLCLRTDWLVRLLGAIKLCFPEVERISSYAGPKDLLRKDPAQLREIQQAGLDLLYMGVESGSEYVLADMKKGVSPNEMIAAGQSAREAGFMLSCMIISGLGGIERLEEHAVESAKVISAIDPDYLGLLTLMLEKNTRLYERVQEGSFYVPTGEQILEETKLFLEHIQLSSCVFRSNHASNYVALKGILNQDRELLLRQLDGALTRRALKPESFRRL